MEDLVLFFNLYGPWLTLIAITGVILLGILKYCKVFDKLAKDVRHVCYLSISVGVSIIGSVIYLACIDELDIAYVAILAGMIYALNQAFYSLFSNTSFNKLLSTLWGKIISSISKGNISSVEDATKELVEDISEAVKESKEDSESDKQSDSENK